MRWNLRWLLLPVAALAGLLLLSYAVSSSTPKVPSYQNKTLYDWTTELQQAQQNYSDPARWRRVEAANAAIRLMGTNALPFVMADVLARPTIQDRVVGWLAPRAKFLKLRPRNVADRWIRGIRAMEVLGPIGKPCLPQLITLATNTTGYSESALLAVGPDALPAFTNLLTTSKFPRTGNLIGAFANAVYARRIKPEEAVVALPYLVQVFRSSDSHGRWYAAGALGAIHENADLCVPLLITGLTDPTKSVREACVQSLGEFGEAASAHASKLADAFDLADAQSRRAICGALAKFRSTGRIGVPVLVRGLQDQDENVRVWAATGLGQLASLPDQAIPALSRALEDSSKIVRLMAAQSLGQFGRQATNAIPFLEHVCSDPDVSVRNVATNALNQIRQ